MIDDFSKPTSLLRRASREDRANLAKILDIEGADKPEQVAYRFHELRAGVIGQFFHPAAEHRLMFAGFGVKQ